MDSAWLKDNLERLHERVGKVCAQYGRNPDEVKIVAVSKTKPIELIREAYNAGQTLFGENRVQELVPKAEVLPAAEWHLVGSLQRNKVKYIAPFVSCIQSLDSISLADEIEKQATKVNRRISCLVQVNISNEPQKGGIESDKLATLLEHVATTCPHIQVDGLMGIAEETDDEPKIKEQFSQLRKYRDDHSSDILATNINLRELSMGMSSDFELAIAEGATLIRVGSSIFGNRAYT